MPRPRRPFATLRFEGPGFEDHGLDARSLRAIYEYQELVAAVAAGMWRRANPDRERITKGFASQFEVRLYRIENGSAVAPLERVQLDPAHMFEPPPDDFDDAADVVTDTINAMARGDLPPQLMPAECLSAFRNFGTSLGTSDRVRVSTPRRQASSAFTSAVRDQIAEFNEPTYEDDIEEVGEVRGADVDSGRYWIRLTDGRKVPGTFAAHDEATVVDALRDHASRRLRVWGRGEFERSGQLTKILETTRFAFEDEPELTSDPRPIWKIVEEIGRSVSDAEWERVPKDGSLRLDEYLEGGGPGR